MMIDPGSVARTVNAEGTVFRMSAPLRAHRYHA